MSLTLTPKTFHDPLNSLLHYSHKGAFLLHPLERAHKNRRKRPCGDLLQHLLKEESEADGWVIDAEFCLEERINITNLRYKI